MPCHAFSGKLAVDGDWLAVTGKDESRSEIFKVKLWKEEMFRQDIELPGVSADALVGDVVLESPFLVVGGTSCMGERVIKVIQLDLNSAASLIKTVQFPDFALDKFLCTRLVWGCLLVINGPPFVPRDNEELSLVLFGKAALLDAANPPEETKGNVIHLGTAGYDLVDVNTTSLVTIQRIPGKDNQQQKYLCKKDFWMSNTIV